MGCRDVSEANINVNSNIDFIVFDFIDIILVPVCLQTPLGMSLSTQNCLDVLR